MDKKEYNDKEFKILQKKNSQLRDKIRKILLKNFPTIDDDYSDLWEYIEDLINNEIEQEQMCN